MNFFLDLIEDLSSFLKSGGFVMWPLVAGTVVLWYALAYRMIMLRRGSRINARELLAFYETRPEAPVRGFIDSAVRIAWDIRRKQSKKIKSYLDDELYFLTEGMNRHRTLVRTIVTVAPLAGLLGTVSGMIEMFDSLGSLTFYSQTGGIANGISQALFTTQFGLVIAVPGLILGRFLDRRQDSMADEIEQIKEFFEADLNADEGDDQV